MYRMRYSLSKWICWCGRHMRTETGPARNQVTSHDFSQISLIVSALHGFAWIPMTKSCFRFKWNLFRIRFRTIRVQNLAIPITLAICFYSCLYYCLVMLVTQKRNHNAGISAQSSRPWSTSKTVGTIGQSAKVSNGLYLNVGREMSVEVTLCSSRFSVNCPLSSISGWKLCWHSPAGEALSFELSATHLSCSFLCRCSLLTVMIAWASISPLSIITHQCFICHIPDNALSLQ